MTGATKLLRAALLAGVIGVGGVGGVPACGGDAYLLVTVAGRPAVHDVASLHVTLTNNGSSRTDDLPLPLGDGLPVTFSVSAPGRAGDLAIAIEARRADGGAAGLGATTARVGDSAATVLLDPSDFVVNTTYADDQILSDDYEANGFQLAALPTGVWTVTYHGPCAAAPCHMLARRFDATGAPVATELAAGTGEFPVSTTLTASTSTSAVAAGGATTVVLWDNNNSATAHGIACRSLDPIGHSSAAEVSVVTDLDSDVVSVAPLAGTAGGFVAVWTGNDPVAMTTTIRTITINDDCTARGAAKSVATATGLFFVHRAAVATRPEGALFAWVADNTIRVRTGSASGAVTGADAGFLPADPAETLDHVRVAPFGAGFAVVVRARAADAMSPGRIVLYRTTVTGARVGTPTVITTRSGSDYVAQDSFAVATRPDGALLVAWSGCNTAGDGSGCGVFGRVVRPTGVPVGDVVVLPTTTTNDQTNPSAAGLDGAFVVAWNDFSAQAPDVAGAAVRARILYPPYDDAVAVLGAACGPGLPACGPGLACVAGGDTHRCFTGCDPAAAPPVCPEGGTCATEGMVAGCAF